MNFLRHKDKSLYIFKISNIWAYYFILHFDDKKNGDNNKVYMAFHVLRLRNIFY